MFYAILFLFLHVTGSAYYVGCSCLYACMCMHDVCLYDVCVCMYDVCLYDRIHACMCVYIMYVYMILCMYVWLGVFQAGNDVIALASRRNFSNISAYFGSLTNSKVNYNLIIELIRLCIVLFDSLFFE